MLLFSCVRCSLTFVFSTCPGSVFVACCYVGWIPEILFSCMRSCGLVETEARSLTAGCEWAGSLCGGSCHTSVSNTRSVPEVMRGINIQLLKIHAITVYPLQSRLLAIEYSDSSVAATLHSSGGSLHLRCFSKPSSQLPELFQLSQNDVL